MTTARSAGTVPPFNGGDAAGIDRAACGQLLTPTEVAAILRRSTHTLAQWRYRGTGPAYVAGGRITYRPEDVQHWITSHTH